MDSKKVFMDFHKNGFQQRNWEWEGDILNTQSSDSLGYTLYSAYIPKTEPRDYRQHFNP